MSHQHCVSKWDHGPIWEQEQKPVRKELPHSKSVPEDTMTCCQSPQEQLQLLLFRSPCQL